MKTHYLNKLAHLWRCFDDSISLIILGQFHKVSEELVYCNLLQTRR